MQRFRCPPVNHTVANSKNLGSPERRRFDGRKISRLNWLVPRKAQIRIISQVRNQCRLGRCPCSLSSSPPLTPLLVVVVVLVGLSEPPVSRTPPATTFLLPPSWDRNPPRRAAPASGTKPRFPPTKDVNGRPITSSSSYRNNLSLHQSLSSNRGVTFRRTVAGIRRHHTRLTRPAQPTTTSTPVPAAVPA